MGRFLRRTLLENPHAGPSLVAGFLPYAAGSMFPRGEVHIDTLLSKDAGGWMGFTRDEVQDLCSIFGGDPTTAWGWYGGCRIGDTEVCDQWSLFYYEPNRHVPKPYWCGNSGNGMADALFGTMDGRTYRGMEGLVDGRDIGSKDVGRIRTMEDLAEDEDAIFSLLVMEGYLRADPSDDGGYRLSIPNREIRPILANIVRARGVLAMYKPMWSLLGSLTGIDPCSADGGC